MLMGKIFRGLYILVWFYKKIVFILKLRILKLLEGIL